MGLQERGPALRGDLIALQNSVCQHTLPKARLLPLAPEEATVGFTTGQNPLGCILSAFCLLRRPRKGAAIPAPNQTSLPPPQASFSPAPPLLTKSCAAPLSAVRVK